MRRAFIAVVLLALACLLPRASRVGMGGDRVDSTSTIAAQGEGVNGRDIYQTPIPIWVTALSTRAFGTSAFTRRLPWVLIAALATGLIFLWGAEATSVTAGACAALMVVSNHLFHTLSTMAMTDAMLLAFTTAAVYSIYSDPWLESRASFWGFAASTAGGVLTKGIAGGLPIAVLGLYWLSVRPAERPAPFRAAAAAGLAIVLTLPWFIYQASVHPWWLETESIIGLSTGVPAQISHEKPIWFYLLRLASTDPILFSGVIVAIPAFVRLLPARKAGPILLACWLALTGAATLAWQYRSASYLLALVPALALVAACYGPFSEKRHASWMLGLLCVALVMKVLLPDAPWGLSYRAGMTNPMAPALSSDGRRSDSVARTGRI